MGFSSIIETSRTSHFIFEYDICLEGVVTVNESIGRTAGQDNRDAGDLEILDEGLIQDTTDDVWYSQPIHSCLVDLAGNPSTSSISAIMIDPW